LCTCKAAAKRSNVYVSGKNNKILPIPEIMLGISTSAESKEERSKKKKKKKVWCYFYENPGKGEYLFRIEDDIWTYF
jgi:hypothetical protein